MKEVTVPEESAGGTAPRQSPPFWAPLRSPVFRGLWLANLVSNVGNTMNDTAAVWTMTTLSHSPLLVTLMQTMSSLPLFLLALPAGALADLVDRRRLIIWAQIGAFVTAAGMVFLALSGNLTAPLLLLATFQLGVASAFTLPAWQALIPDILGRQQLSAALALGSVGFNLARALGPVVGGLLVAAAGPAMVFGLNTLSFGVMIFVAARTKLPETPRGAEQERMMGAMVAALRYTRHATAMQAVLWRAGLHVFAATAPVTLLPILLRRLGGTGSDFGFLMGCYGGGAIIVALFVLPKLRMSWSFDRVIMVAAIGSAASAALLAIASERYLMAPVLAMAGASWMCALNTFSVAAQSAFPNWVRARSSAIYLVVVQGSFAIGALAWGRLLTDFGGTAALFTAAVWLLATLALTKRFPISHLEKLELSPSHHWPDHSLAVEPAPEDGPVLITVEYHIDPARSEEFRLAMGLLRKTRLRDGAYRATLFVDLNDPSLYRETFLVGSWAEHLRQHNRATVEDERIESAVLAFHLGDTPPRLRHLLMIET